MAKGYLDKFINWLAKMRYSTTYSDIMDAGSTWASTSSAQMAERCGIMSFNAVFVLSQNTMVSKTGTITYPTTPFELATIKSAFRPKTPIPFISRGQSFQFYGYIDTDGRIMVSGGQSRGEAYTINSGYQVRIGAVYPIGAGVTTESV